MIDFRLVTSQFGRHYKAGTRVGRVASPSVSFQTARRPDMGCDYCTKTMQANGWHNTF